ncbi:MFS transporter [Paraburkholderia silviterrae]|uniref:MFS transporter n=1 Tax=Paraburkholderia silviterrae TaxID=2528715 RepID=A0A4R5MAB9_9BURK|nr:MFS transporter [Paraburkholderia silviterrae]TDG23665.1 MFS transporter [Paraburkholderia silviterrae]
MTTTSTHQHSKRWLLSCLLFFLGWVMMYADRSILSPVQELVRQQFGLSNGAVGLISSVFFIVYAIAQIPSGILGDRMGRIKLITVGFVIFGIATLLTGVTGLMHLFALFLIMRAMAGLGEGLYYGPQFAKSNEITPTRYRALGAAIINSGQGVGIAVGIMASSFIAFDLKFGWPWAFIIFGALTLVVGLLIAIGIPDAKPAQAPAKLSAELRRFGALLGNRTLLGTFIMLFCGVYTFFVMVTWLPTYLHTAFNMSFGKASSISSIAFWLAVPAGMLMGYFSDRFRNRRAFVILLTPLTIVSVLVMAFAPNVPTLIVSIVLYGVFGKLSLDPVLISIVADHVPDAQRSSAYGLYNCIGMIAAILAPYATGTLVDITGSFQTAFIVSVVLLATGAVIFFFTYRPPASPLSSKDANSPVAQTTHLV